MKKILLFCAFSFFITLVITNALVTNTEQKSCLPQVKKVAPHIAEQAIKMIALNIYFHRGNENTTLGKKAITAVVFNRVKDCEHDWPRSIRSVIKGGTERGKYCDFSWQCDGAPDIPGNAIRYASDQGHAALWFKEYLAGTFEDPTSGATWFIYKEDTVPKSWPKLERTATIGQYTFYRYP